MDCRRCQELLSPLCDGELPIGLSGPILAHLERCPECRARADSLRSLGGVVRAVGGEAPAGLGARILSEAQSGRVGPSVRRPGRLASAWPRAAAMLAGAAAVALLVPPPVSTPLPAGRESRSGFDRLVTESQTQLELAGSFRGEFRSLSARPEERLMFDLIGGRR